MPIQFTNVPKVYDLPLAANGICGECKNPNLAPFRVMKCEHTFCGGCWQKAACNIGSEENRCPSCGYETDLLCFKDYNRFVGHNMFNGDLQLDTERIREYVLESEMPKDAKETALQALDTHEKAVFKNLQAEIFRRRKDRRLKAAWSGDRVDHAAKKARFSNGTTEKDTAGTCKIGHFVRDR